MPERIQVSSTKYDGSLHYRYEVDLVEVGDAHVRVREVMGTPWLGYRGEGHIRHEATTVYYTNRWYNVSHFREPAGRRGMRWYVNIGTPATLEDGVLRWVDLDVDVILDAAGIRVDDEDEFEAHRVRFGYPEDLVQRVLDTRDEVLAMARTRHPALEPPAGAGLKLGRPVQ